MVKAEVVTGWVARTGVCVREDEAFSSAANLAAKSLFILLCSWPSCKMVLCCIANSLTAGVPSVVGNSPPSKSVSESESSLKVLLLLLLIA